MKENTRITASHDVLFRLYFSIEPVVRARRLAAENQIEMCDDRDDCCSGNAFQKHSTILDRRSSNRSLCNDLF